MPIRVLLMGAGNRGFDAYGQWVLDNPDKASIVAVADNDASKLQRAKKTFALTEENLFTDWRRALDATTKNIDAVIVALPDNQHEEAALAVMAAKHHLLLEKPAANTLAGSLKLFKTAQKNNCVLRLGYVLRHSAFFLRVQEIVRSGRLGEIVTIEWRENVSALHMSHSFVRGNWAKEQESSPMILAKCSHDLDMLGFILNKEVKRIASTGGLYFFKPEHAPKNAAKRCLDDCPAEKDCAFFAPNIYLTNNTEWPTSTISADLSFDARQAAIKTGPYGACVFYAGNDVVDHQVVMLEFENGISGTLTMHGHSAEEGRSLRIDGTKASLRGVFRNSLQEILIEQHTLAGMHGQDSQRVPILETDAQLGAGHGGGDEGLMAAFINDVETSFKTGLVENNLDADFESHFLAFAIEQARQNCEVLDMDSWRKDILQIHAI